MTKVNQRREFLSGLLAIPLLALGFSRPAFGAFSEFVVLTPKNDLYHGFRIQTFPVPSQADHTRVRVTWPLDEYQQMWLVECKKSLPTEQQNFRPLVWGETDEDGVVVSIKPMERQSVAGAETERVQYAYVEIALPNEQLTRSYLYIDFPQPLNDGGYYYSIELAYYLDGPLGKKSDIYWEE